jgi:lysozyme
MRIYWLLALAVACANTATTSSVDEQSTVCGVGPTVKGIDVSYYQGTIDWKAVKNDGVAFAFIRVSDGTGFIDPNFPTYWAESRAAGIVHGAYQYFRPGSDPIAQADLLLSKIGSAMQPDDLPPVIDVETTDGLGTSAVAAAVKAWVDHVAAAIGRPPIIYTGFYSWRDMVGGADMTTSPLWHAQYTTASCPNIAAPWTSWAVWQYTSTGTVAGISSAMDVDRWNGDMASLTAFLGPRGGGAAPCGTIAPSGGEIDTTSPCFVDGGPAAGLRHVTNAGQGGSLVWTHATSNATEQNFATWNLYFAEAGTYRVSVATPASYAQSKQAKYVVHTATGDTDVTVDQTAVDGWQSLGEIAFAAGGQQFVHLGDNTGEPSANNVQLVFDGVKLERVDGSGSGSGDGSGGGTTHHHAGCATGGDPVGLAFALASALLGLRRRRAAAIFV